ncbi:MAG: NAD-dependent DNA ligase LigA [Myxococcota bacterium]
MARDQVELHSETQLLHRLPSYTVPQLERLVRCHNAAYFDENNPRISDPAFDRLVERLRALKPGSGALQELGERPPPKQQEVIHRQPMLSLDKCYDEAAFAKWYDKAGGTLLVMPKIDGLACTLHYDLSGAFKLAATRGDGDSGEDVTHNVRAIADVPEQLKRTFHGDCIQKGTDILEVRGEIYLKLSRFREHYADAFANPRNLAAGALKQKDAAKSAAYGLSFFPYEILGARLKSEQHNMELLTALGFTLPTHRFTHDQQEALAAYEYFARHRGALDYEIDGVVFRVDDIARQAELGSTAHHPRFCLAYKFQGEVAQTRLRAVEWSVARTGTITPVACIDPVFISGARVARASLHNVGRMRELGLTVGALVEVARRGGVIPHVQRVLPTCHSREGGNPDQKVLEPLIPQECPSCGGPTVLEGDFLKCARPQACVQVAWSRLRHFCSVMELEGFGPRLLQQLVQQDLVLTPAALYRLAPQDLTVLERMGEVSATKLVRQVQDKRRVPFATFLAALGLAEIGPVTARAIAQQYTDLSCLSQATQEDLASVRGVGEVVARSIVEGFRTQHEEIEQLCREIEIVPDEGKPQSADASENSSESSGPLVGKGPSAPKARSAPLAGKRVVFTGKLTQLTRKQAQRRVRALGGETPGAVSTSTDYLVVGGDGRENQRGASSKMALARQLNQASRGQIAIVSEEEFVQRLHEWEDGA